MARTNSKKKPQNNVVTIEYKGCKIVKEPNRMYINTGSRNIRVKNRGEAVEIIDELVQECSTTKPEWPRGGYTMHPPMDCDKRVRFEAGGNFWVENVICIFYCKKTECEVYKRINAGASERIRKLKDGSSLVINFEIRYQTKKGNRTRTQVEKGTIKVEKIDGVNKPEDVEKIQAALKVKFKQHKNIHVVNLNVAKGGNNENTVEDSEAVAEG